MMTISNKSERNDGVKCLAVGVLLATALIEARLHSDFYRGNSMQFSTHSPLNSVVDQNDGNFTYFDEP